MNRMLAALALVFGMSVAVDASATGKYNIGFSKRRAEKRSAFRQLRSTTLARLHRLARATRPPRRI